MNNNQSLIPLAKQFGKRIGHSCCKSGKSRTGDNFTILILNNAIGLPVIVKIEELTKGKMYNIAISGFNQFGERIQRNLVYTFEDFADVGESVLSGIIENTIEFHEMLSEVENE